MDLFQSSNVDLKTLGVSYLYWLRKLNCSEQTWSLKNARVTENQLFENECYFQEEQSSKHHVKLTIKTTRATSKTIANKNRLLEIPEMPKKQILLQ